MMFCHFTFLFLATVFSALGAVPNSSDVNEEVLRPCAFVEKAFRSVAKQEESPICQCVMNAPTPMSEISPSSNPPQFWIGCTRHKMTAVFRALQTLNETRVSHLHIWDSLINILPNDPKPMFMKVLADKLTIERSRVGVIREGAFANIGQTLKSLSLRNNILKSVDAKALSDLSELRQLDLSWNKLAELRRSHFAQMVHLESLILASNQLSKLEDGLFQPLTKLRVLNLANNSIKKITRDMFKGLTKLEELILTDNKISYIDKDAFVDLKALRVLDLGINNVSHIELHGNAALERLVLHNNSIASLSHCKFTGLTRLRTVQLGNNNITSIEDMDLRGLAQSPALISLALDGNNISRIGCRAFIHVSDLVVLSLQRNRISTLSCSSTYDPISLAVYLDRSFLHPLHKLKRLLLSHNSIQILNEDDFIGLTSLAELALDNNKISKVSKNALIGLQLRKLFLNNNQLYYLPENLFNGWDLLKLQAIDLSDNPWECVCGREWIGKWLKMLPNETNSPSGDQGCLARECAQEASPSATLDEKDESRSQQEGFYDPWIRLVACVLAFVAILFLVIAGYVYMQESRYALISLRRTSSDTIRLIPSLESLFSLPNPIVGAEDACPPPPYPGMVLPHHHPAVPSIAINANGGKLNSEDCVGGKNLAEEQQQESSRKQEEAKKRVRFQ